MATSKSSSSSSRTPTSGSSSTTRTGAGYKPSAGGLQGGFGSPGYGKSTTTQAQIRSSLNTNPSRNGVKLATPAQVASARAANPSNPEYYRGAGYQNYKQPPGTGKITGVQGGQGMAAYGGRGGVSYDQKMQAARAPAVSRTPQPTYTAARTPKQFNTSLAQDMAAGTAVGNRQAAGTYFAPNQRSMPALPPPIPPAIRQAAAPSRSIADVRQPIPSRAVVPASQPLRGPGGMNSNTLAPYEPGGSYDPDRAAVWQGSNKVGVRPQDLVTAMQYETIGTMDPNKRGGMNRDGSGAGSFRGLLQFSPENQKKYGVTPGMTIAQQMPAVTRYLTDRGVKPRDGLPQIYAAINAGQARYANDGKRHADVNGTLAENTRRAAATYGGRASEWLRGNGATSQVADSGSYELDATPASYAAPSMGGGGRDAGGGRYASAISSPTAASGARSVAGGYNNTPRSTNDLYGGSAGRLTPVNGTLESVLNGVGLGGIASGANWLANLPAPQPGAAHSLDENMNFMSNPHDGMPSGQGNNYNPYPLDHDMPPPPMAAQPAANSTATASTSPTGTTGTTGTTGALQNTYRPPINYYQYGMGPEQQMFSNNSLA